MKRCPKCGYVFEGEFFACKKCGFIFDEKHQPYELKAGRNTKGFVLAIIGLVITLVLVPFNVLAIPGFVLGLISKNISNHYLLDSKYNKAARVLSIIAFVVGLIPFVLSCLLIFLVIVALIVITIAFISSLIPSQIMFLM